MGPILNAPIILDLGKTGRKKIRQLKRGQGTLLDDIQGAMAEITASLGKPAEGEQFVPVVLVYRKKAKKKSVNGCLENPLRLV